MRMDYTFFYTTLTIKESLKIIEELENDDNESIEVINNNYYDFCHFNICEKLEDFENEIVSLFDKNTYVDKNIANKVLSYIKIINKHSSKDFKLIKKDFNMYLFDNRLNEYFSEEITIKDMYEYCNSLKEFDYRSKDFYFVYPNVEYVNENVLQFHAPIFDYSERQNNLVGYEDIIIDIEDEKNNLVYAICSDLEKELNKTLHDLTEHDKDIDPSTLTQEDIKQALNNSIDKFIELHYQQPKEYKPILKNINISIVENEISVIKTMIQNNDDIKLLIEIFRVYKQDLKNIYNYSLFGYINFRFGIKVSDEYIYNSSMLKRLNLYKIEKDREKPTIKKNAIETLRTQQVIYTELEDKESIFIDNLINFLNEYIPKKYNYYSISYLTNELNNSMTNAKDFIEHLEMKQYKNLSKKLLPDVINTLLLPAEKLINS